MQQNKEQAMEEPPKRLYQLGFALLLGQFLSLLITATGLTSSILAREDVEGNYAVVKAYQYTALTSVMLLDCWTIPSVLLLTWVFLKTKYKVGQLVGVCICIAGLVLVIFSDVHAGDRTAGSNPLLGDILVSVGSILYAVANVSEEFLIKNVDYVELMTFLGSFGALISACQLSILERHELESIHWTANSVAPFIGFAVALFLFYTLVPLLLKISGSAMLNLSLLTSDMWAVAIRVFAYHQMVDWLYFVAFAMVAVGLIIYSTWSNNEKSCAMEPREGASKEEVACHCGDTIAYRCCTMEPPEAALTEEVVYESVDTIDVEDDGERREREEFLPARKSEAECGSVYKSRIPSLAHKDEDILDSTLRV